jgi:hypothetical protein
VDVKKPHIGIRVSSYMRGVGYVSSGNTLRVFVKW